MWKAFTPSALRQAFLDVRQGGYLVDAAVTRPWLRLIAFAVLGALITALVMVGMGVVLAALPSSLIDPAILTLDPGAGWTLGDEMQFVAVLAATLILIALSLLGAAMLVYRKPARAFLWPRPGLWVTRFIVGFVVMMGLGVLALPIAHGLSPEAVAPLFDTREPLNTRLVYVGVAGLGLLIAAAAEEIAFRGVLLRVTAALTRRVWLLVIVNGVLFSAIHLDPDPVAFVARALSGMVWTWAALRLGGISFAVGAHWANNLFIALFMEPISTAAMPGRGIPPEVLAFELLTTLVVFAAVELLVWKRRTTA